MWGELGGEILITWSGGDVCVWVACVENTGEVATVRRLIDVFDYVRVMTL